MYLISTVSKYIQILWFNKKTNNPIKIGQKMWINTKDNICMDNKTNEKILHIVTE